MQSSFYTDCTETRRGESWLTLPSPSPPRSFSFCQLVFCAELLSWNKTSIHLYILFNVLILCSLQVKGFELLKEVAESTNPDAAHLTPFAQYNVGRAYYEGFGVKQSDKQAERWFLTAAQDGEPSGSIKAQTVLGMFYSRADEESFDLQKVGFSINSFCTMIQLQLISYPWMHVLWCSIWMFFFWTLGSPIQWIFSLATSFKTFQWTTFAGN